MYNKSEANKYKSLRIPKQLFEKMKKHSKDTETPINAIIRGALADFFYVYEDKPGIKYQKIRNRRDILKNISVDGMNDKIEIKFYIRDNDTNLMDEINTLEKLQVCHNTEDCIRRILTWHLIRQKRRKYNEHEVIKIFTWYLEEQKRGKYTEHNN